MIHDQATIDRMALADRLIFVSVDNYLHAMNKHVYKYRIHPNPIRPVEVEYVEEFQSRNYSLNLKETIYNLNDIIQSEKSIVVIHEETTYYIFVNIEKRMSKLCFFRYVRESDKDYELVKKLIANDKKEMVINIEHPDIIIRTLAKRFLNNWTFTEVKV